MATIGLGFQLSANAAKMSGGVNEAVKQLARISEAAEKTARDTSTLKNLAIGAVVFKGASMVADAFTSAGRAALSYAANVATSVDATNDLAQRIGMGVESLQSLQVAAKLGGVDDITAHLQKMTIAMGNAASSGKTEAFTALGLDFQTLQGMAPEDQFREIAAAIAKLPTEAERAAAAMKIFGKSGIELLPMFNQNLAEAETRARRLGIVLSEDQVNAIGGMNDSLDMVKKTFDGIIGQVVSYLAPAVQAVADEFLLFVENFEGGGSGMAEAIAEKLIEVGKFLAGVFDRFIGGLGWFLEGLGSWVSSDLEKIGKGIREFGEAGHATAAMKSAERGFMDRNNPEREAQRRQREADRKAARQAAAAAAAAEREAQIQEKIADASKFKEENARALGGRSNEALRAADVRTAEGMSAYLALAAGREDPAIAENRKQNQKLQEIIAELRNGNQQPVEIMGAAA